MPAYVTSPFSLLEVVDNVNITVKPLHKWQTEAHTTLVGIHIHQSRVEICRDRHDQWSCKFFALYVKT